MITEYDYEDYRNSLKDCPLDALLRMNDMIATELSNRYFSKYVLPMPTIHSEISKLKTFMDTFNALQKGEGYDVNETELLTELRRTGKFDEKEAKLFLKKAMQNGQIYERRAEYYAKA